MTERSSTRKQLEQSLRELLPLDDTAAKLSSNESMNVASAGVGGLFAGYLWGFLRGRRSARRK